MRDPLVERRRETDVAAVDDRIDARAPQRVEACGIDRIDYHDRPIARPVDRAHHRECAVVGMV